MQIMEKRIYFRYATKVIIHNYTIVDFIIMESFFYVMSMIFSHIHWKEEIYSILVCSIFSSYSITLLFNYKFSIISVYLLGGILLFNISMATTFITSTQIGQSNTSFSVRTNAMADKHCNSKRLRSG